MVTAPGGVRAAPARDQLDQFIKKFVCVCVHARASVQCYYTVTTGVNHMMYSLLLIS